MPKQPTNLPVDDEQKLPTPTACFRLIADFTVEAKTARTYLQRPEVTPQEHDVFLLILTTPEALNRMCRLAIVSDFEAFLWDRHFDGKFVGPNPTDILDALLPYLPEELKAWWMQLRRENYDGFSARMDTMFQEFCSSLTHATIEDMSSGEPIPLECRSKQT